MSAISEESVSLTDEEIKLEMTPLPESISSKLINDTYKKQKTIIREKVSRTSKSKEK